jgi:CDP-diacylglycerol--serine O-phosphatidyltransferase
MELKKYIANILTYCNLLFGTLSIIITAVTPSQYPDYSVPLVSALIIAAALLDRYDGRLARVLNAETEFGKELDSLADLVSFGIAPMVIAWKSCMYIIGPFSIAPVLAFCVCGASRLARFNISRNKGEYTGMPITIAGGLVAVVIFCSYFILEGKMQSHAFIITLNLFILLLSYFMVCNIKVKKI